MKFPVNLSFAFVALIILVGYSATPCHAANTKSTKKKSAWPQWYYYDQLGLRQWNAGKKAQAETLFKRSYNMMDRSLHARKGHGLDPVTKRRFLDVLNHQMFLVSYFKTPAEASLRGLEGNERAATVLDSEIEQSKEKLKLIERVKNTYKKYYGNDGKRVYDYDKAITQLRVRVIQKKANVETLRKWPRRSYDNGGRYSTGHYHINKDGTTTNISGPTEAFLRAKDQTFDKNEWYKKNSREKKSGSYYRGLKPTLGHEVPEWYSGRKTRRKVDANYRRLPSLPRNSRTAKPNSKNRDISQRVAPKPWGAPKPKKVEIKPNDSQKNVPWGQKPSPKKGTNYRPWGTTQKKKYQPKPQKHPFEQDRN